MMKRVSVGLLASLCAIGALIAGAAAAQENIKHDSIKQDSIKIGLVMPMTGVLGQAGRQTVAGARLYVQQHGDVVAGRKIELIVRDDASIPDNAKRLAQELITTGGVTILGGGLTPSVLAMAPLVTQSRTATVVMISGTSIVTERSPYFVRTSWTHAQQASVVAIWAARNGARRATIISSDWAPGHEAAGVFAENFTKAGGQIVESLKVPLTNPDFAPFLQRARDGAPDTLFIFVPSPQAEVLSKQFVERGLDKTGIHLIGPGDITDDEHLAGMSEAMLGTVTAGFYSPDHPSAMNRDYVAAFRKANPQLTPNFASVSGYDGMHLIYAALEKTGGNTDGAALVEAMKGMAWESPRGPMAIDPLTRDVVHNIYIRRVEKVEGVLTNHEFETFVAVADPAKVATRQ